MNKSFKSVKELNDYLDSKGTRPDWKGQPAGSVWHPQRIYPRKVVKPTGRTPEEQELSLQITKEVQDQSNIKAMALGDTYIVMAAPEMETLKNNKKALTDEERAEVMKAGAVWHHGPNGEETPAIWKAVVKGKDWFVCNTHRAMQVKPTLKGAIKAFDFIKTTASLDRYVVIKGQMVMTKTGVFTKDWKKALIFENNEKHVAENWAQRKNGAVVKWQQHYTRGTALDEIIKADEGGVNSPNLENPEPSVIEDVDLNPAGFEYEAISNLNVGETVIASKKVTASARCRFARSYGTDDYYCSTGCNAAGVRKGGICPWGQEDEVDWEVASQDCACYKG